MRVQLLRRETEPRSPLRTLHLDAVRHGEGTERRDAPVTPALYATSVPSPGAGPLGVCSRRTVSCTAPLLKVGPEPTAGECGGVGGRGGSLLPARMDSRPHTAATAVSVSGTDVCADGVSTQRSSTDRGTTHVRMFISTTNPMRSGRRAHRRGVSPGGGVGRVRCVLGASLRSCSEREAKRIISFYFQPSTQPALHGPRAVQQTFMPRFLAPSRHFRP